MPPDFTTPLDRRTINAPPGRRHVDTRSLRGSAADLSFIVLKAIGFLGSTYLMTLGLPLLVLVLLSGAKLDALFAQLGSLAGHFAAAPPPAKGEFARFIALGLVGASSMLAILRLPRFLTDVSDELATRGQQA